MASTAKPSHHITSRSSSVKSARSSNPQQPPNHTSTGPDRRTAVVAAGWPQPSALLSHPAMAHPQPHLRPHNPPPSSSQHHHQQPQQQHHQHPAHVLLQRRPQSQPALVAPHRLPSQPHTAKPRTASVVSHKSGLASPRRVGSTPAAAAAAAAPASAAAAAKTPLSSPRIGTPRGASKHVIRRAELNKNLEEKRHPLRQEFVRHARSLGDETGLTKIGIHYTVIAPGGISTVKHMHACADEFMFILEGEGELELDDQTVFVHAGDFVGLPAKGPAHRVKNVSETDNLVYLMGGDRATMDVCFYPEERKRVYLHHQGTTRTLDFVRDEHVFH